MTDIKKLAEKIYFQGKRAGTKAWIELLLARTIEEIELDLATKHTCTSRKLRDIAVSDAYSQAAQVVKQAMKHQDEYGLADGDWILEELSKLAKTGRP